MGVAIIGSGNWGSAIAKIIGRNVLSKSGFDDEVKMWVFQEKVDGKNLTDIINAEHENVKYLPGIKFTENVVADPDLASACEGATMLVFVMPHQFIPKKDKWATINLGKGCRAISLIKGIEFNEDGPLLISGMIKEIMSQDVSVLMGANVANEVARYEFCESTVGYADEANGVVWQQLLDCPTFRIGKINDVAGTELCGALKNVVALGAGFCDGLGLGGNTKAAIIRIGLKETAKFAKMFFSVLRTTPSWNRAVWLTSLQLVLAVAIANVPRHSLKGRATGIRSRKNCSMDRSCRVLSLPRTSWLCSRKRDLSRISHFLLRSTRLLSTESPHLLLSNCRA